MVFGINTFIKYFKDYKNQYVLIGGTACDIIMQEQDIQFRATKDLDIVLIIEALDESFGKKFWEFIEDGGYKDCAKTSASQQFYRFTKPTTPMFPTMIELFSKKDFNLHLNSRTSISPIHIDDNIKSLSAILLNDDYYELVKKGKKENDELSYLSNEMVILFKIKAYLDLKERKRNGESVDSRDMKKHRNDIFRLLSVIDPELKVELPNIIKKDISVFIEQIKEDKPALKDLGIRNTSFDKFIELLNEIYL